MTKRNSFVLYHATAEDLIDLTDEECGKLFRALFDYAINGTQPSLSPLCMMAFRHIRQYIDANDEKYRIRCEKNSAAGKISGQVRRQASEARHASEARQASVKGDTDSDRHTADDAYREYEQNEQMNENANIGAAVFTDGNLYEYGSASEPVSVSAYGSESESESESVSASGSAHGSEAAAAFAYMADAAEAVDGGIPSPLSDTDPSRADQRVGAKEQEDAASAVQGVPYAVPSLAQVQAYCAEQRLHTDPSRFFRINEANGWCVGGKPIRDWRALLRGWSKYDGEAMNAASRPRAPDETPVDESLLTPEQRWDKSFHEMVEKILSTPPDQLHYENI